MSPTKKKSSSNPLFNSDAFMAFIITHKVLGFYEEPITLKSGRNSHFYVNWRPITSDVYLIDVLTDFILNFVNDLGIHCDTLYGVPEGATKLGVIAQYKFAKQQAGFSLGSAVLAMGRSKPKGHGAPSDRFFIGEPRGDVILIEDVTTTGASLMNTLIQLDEIGIDVKAAIGLTDRMELRDDGLSVGAYFKEFGVPYFAMSRATDILSKLIHSDAISIDIIHSIQHEFESYGVSSLLI